MRAPVALSRPLLEAAGAVRNEPRRERDFSKIPRDNPNMPRQGMGIPTPCAAIPRDGPPAPRSSPVIPRDRVLAPPIGGPIVHVEELRPESPGQHNRRPHLSWPLVGALRQEALDVLFVDLGLAGGDV